MDLSERRKRIESYLPGVEEFIRENYQDDVVEFCTEAAYRGKKTPGDKYSREDVSISAEEDAEFSTAAAYAPEEEPGDECRREERPPVKDEMAFSTRPKMPEEHHTDVHFSLEPDFDHFEQRFSTKISPKRISELRDRYDSEAIDRAIRSQIQSSDVSGLIDALEQTVNQTFVDRVIALIRVRDVKDSAVYKAAQIDRRLFSKMMSDRMYKPSKDTAIAVALALQLPLTQASDLLSRAGYAFSHSDKRDVVIEYFFRERIYDLIDINLVLEKLDLKLIGR